MYPNLKVSISFWIASLFLMTSTGLIINELLWELWSLPLSSRTLSVYLGWHESQVLTMCGRTVNLIQISNLINQPANLVDFYQGVYRDRENYFSRLSNPRVPCLLRLGIKILFPIQICMLTSDLQQHAIPSSVSLSTIARKKKQLTEE